MQNSQPTPTQPPLARSGIFRIPFIKSLAALTGFLLVLIPSAAQAIDTSRTVHVTVVVGDETNTRPLPNTKLRVLEFPDGDQGEATEVVTATTNATGEAVFQFDTLEDTYTLEADWLTVPGALLTTQEFSSSQERIEVSLGVSYGYAAGAIQAFVGGEALADLTGASVQILAGDIVVETLSLTAAGTFETALLPRLNAGYSLTFIPPTGYALAVEQSEPNSGFEIPDLTADPNTFELSRSIDLVSTAPTPDPEPEPEPSGTTPAPTPIEPQTDLSLMVPNRLGSIPGLSYATGTSASPSQGLDVLSMTQDELAALLRASAQSDGPLILTNNLNQVIGLAVPPTGESLQELLRRLSALLPRAGSSNQATGSDVPRGGSEELTAGLAHTALSLMSPAQGVSAASTLMGAGGVNANPLNVGTGGALSGINLATFDLETALILVQQDRASLLERQLESQLDQVNARNNKIAKLNAVHVDMNRYNTTRTQESFEKAKAALEEIASDIGYDDVRLAEFKLVPLPKGEFKNDPYAVDAITKIKLTLDALSNSQQMDMLRLQSLSNKRNEAFDVMTNFIKKMQDQRSSIIGNMRSTPTDLGTIQWNKGTVSAPFDLSQVAPGEHHGLFEFEDFGVTFVTEVTVTGPQLADTGISTKMSVGISSALVLFGALLVVFTERRLRKPVHGLSAQ